MVKKPAAAAEAKKPLEEAGPAAGAGPDAEQVETPPDEPESGPDDRAARIAARKAEREAARTQDAELDLETLTALVAVCENDLVEAVASAEVLAGQLLDTVTAKGDTLLPHVRNLRTMTKNVTIVARQLKADAEAAIKAAKG